MDAEPVPATADAAPVATPVATPAATPPATAATQDRARTLRAAEIVRDIAIGGIASLIAGILVVGVGGRLVMRVIAALNPEATGLLTTAGATIGEITTGGTMFFVVMFGLLAGGTVGVVWAIVSPWIPGSGAVRALASALVAIAIGAFLVVRTDEGDFRKVAPAAAIALLVVLFGVLGIAVAGLDERLRRRLPAASASSTASQIAYVVLATIGLVFVTFVVSAYFTRADFPTEPGVGFSAPVTVGVALVVVAVATIAAWWQRVSTGEARLPRAFEVFGRGALGVAVILGAIRLAGEVSGLLAA
ncbi:MAG: hypothetical protein ABIQ76_05200 [Candidatus Limnocylindrales bacterium]